MAMGSNDVVYQKSASLVVGTPKRVKNHAWREGEEIEVRLRMPQQVAHTNHLDQNPHILGVKNSFNIIFFVSAFINMFNVLE